MFTIPNNPNERFLKETTYINFSDPKIQAALNNTLHINALKTPKQKALAIHNFIRDEILFGFNPLFYDLKASDVLALKRGYAVNKSTLFVAMLRAVGIPSRQVFVDISKKLLKGLSPIMGTSVLVPTKYLDHCYTEVLLDNKWLKVDSYVVDGALFKAAQAKLSEARNRKLMGWALHRDGTNEWDGEKNAFSQFINKCEDDCDCGVPGGSGGGNCGGCGCGGIRRGNVEKRISKNFFGVYDDVKEFYKKEENAWNKNNFVQNLSFFDKINDDIENLRNTGKN